MKTLSLCMVMALLCLACNKTNEDALHMKMCSFDISPPACNAPPPMVEMVKFVPPVINDDEALEETSHKQSSSENKNKKIIKDGHISICVASVETSKKYIDTILKKFDAYYETEEFVNNDDRSSYDLTIRIPSKRFEQFLKATENGGGKIRSKNINARDVSEEYYDTEVRLGSKKVFRDHYNHLLRKATKVPDILSIEENLRVLQEEIESQQGHLKYVDDQVDYSTLNVNLFTEVILMTEKNERSFLDRIKSSMGNGWDNIITALLWTIKQWPWVVVFTVLNFIIRKYIKKRKQKKEIDPVM